MKKVLLLVSILALMFTLSACTSAERVSSNLSREAEEFKILRDIRATNGITDKVIFEGVGFCSIETAAADVAGMMEITCKVGEDAYTKDFVYLSDNVTISVMQLEGYDVPQYHKEFIFSAQSLIPMLEFTGDELGE